MPFLTLSEGHYRALEESLSALVGSIPVGTPVALVTAGQFQSSRMAQVLTRERSSPLPGVDLLPGMVHLAAKLCDFPCTRRTVSAADRTAIALEAMAGLDPGDPFSDMAGNTSSASSLGSFFERLLEQGITPEMYRVSTNMLPSDPGQVEVVTGDLFETYTGLRNRLCPFTSDLIVSASPGGSCMYRVIVFYGFYDLNPGQRRFVRRLSGTGADIHWFSPVHPSSPWRDVYDRTGEFLRGLGFRERHRVDWNRALSPSAEAAGALLKGSVPEDSPFCVTSAAGVTGNAREVLDTVLRLGREGVPARDIAVVSRGSGNPLLVRLAHHEGVPVAAPLTSPLADLPLARLAADITRLPAWDFHYSSLEALAATGCLADDVSPGPREIVEAVRATGVRSGLEGWRSALRGDSPLRRLLDVLGGFFDSRDSACPSDSLSALRDLLVRISGRADDDPLLDRIFRREDWHYDEPVGWQSFSALFRQHLSETVTELRPGDRDGFRLLTYEQARGTLWPVLILLDLEDEVFPSRQIDDPRLPADLRELLELPDMRKRELEEAFLLFQAFEAGGSRVFLVNRYQDSMGRPVRPSPFVAPLFTVESAGSARRPASPMGTLLGGSHPGQALARSCAETGIPSGRYFLSRAVLAEKSRFSAGPFDEYDGHLGPGFFDAGKWSASILEDYVRCPFEFMARKIWELPPEEGAGVSFEPDPRERGSLVHRCIERLAAEGFECGEERLMKILSDVAEERGLWRNLGSRPLADSWLRKLSETLLRAQEGFRRSGWQPLGSELKLEGSLAGLPFTGRIDLLLRKPDGSLLVVDVKTGRPGGSAETLAGRIENGSLHQPHVYRSLMQSNLSPDDAGERIGMAYVYVRHGAPFEPVELPDGILEGLGEVSAANVAGVVGLITGGRFPPVSSSGSSCRNCDLRDLCRSTPASRVDHKLRADGELELLRRARSG